MNRELIHQPFFEGLHLPVGGTVADWLDIKFFVPLGLDLREIGGDLKLAFVFDYYGLRYHLLMVENVRGGKCVENVLLRNAADAIETERDWYAETCKCLDAFWPFFGAESAKRMRGSEETPSLSQRFLRKETAKMQMCTRDDGTVCVKPHDDPLFYPLSEPVVNPCPPGVPVFSMANIVLEREVYRNVFKAKRCGEVVCMKVASAEDTLTELKAMLRVAPHPNVNHPLLGVVEAENENGLNSIKSIDKFLIPFVEGRALARYLTATVQQKATWKSQISSAVSSLHDSGVAWGDVAERNVMIEAGTWKAVVIDFGMSSVKGHPSFDSAMKMDLANLQGLMNRIDNLPVSAEPMYS